MVPLPDLVKPSKLLNFEQNLGHQPEFSTTEKNLCIGSQPVITFPPALQSQPDLSFSSESQDLLARFGDPYFDMLGSLDASKLGNGELSFGPPFLEPAVSCGTDDAREKFDTTADSFFDDFPIDMFDQIELLPKPSP